MWGNLPEVMTENDERLVAKAKASHTGDWNAVDQLIDQADSEEVKEWLISMMKRRYREEEYQAGML